MSSNKLSIETIRSYQFSNSRDWKLLIQEDGVGSSLPSNLINNFPATTFNISDLNIIVNQINAPQVSLSYHSSCTINSITLGFIDVVGDPIYNWLRDWRCHCFSFDKGVAGIADSGVTKLFTFIRLNPLGDEVWRRSYLVIPTDDPQFMGTAASGNNEYTISLTVVGTGTSDSDNNFIKTSYTNGNIGV